MKDTYFNAESVNQTFEDIGRMGGREVDPFMKVSFEAKRPKFVYLYYWSNVFKDAGRGGG
jgi:hypothetical protein